MSAFIMGSAASPSYNAVKCLRLFYGDGDR